MENIATLGLGYCEVNVPSPRRGCGGRGCRSQEADPWASAGILRELASMPCRDRGLQFLA